MGNVLHMIYWHPLYTFRIWEESCREGDPVFMHRMFVVYEAYRTKNIHSVCVRNSCSRANFTSCTTRTNRTTWQGPFWTTLLTNSKRRQWEAISPVVQLKRVAPLDRTTSVHLSSCLMRCSQVMYCTLFHSNVSYLPLEPKAQLNDSYHLILTLDDLNKWWVLDMCGEFDLTMKLVTILVQWTKIVTQRFLIHRNNPNTYKTQFFVHSLEKMLWDLSRRAMNFYLALCT